VEVAGFSETLERSHVLRCVWIHETLVWDGHITIEIVAFCIMIQCSLNMVTTSEVTLCVFFRLKLGLKFRVLGSSKALVSARRRPRRPQFALEWKNSNLINMYVTLVWTLLQRPNYEVMKLILGRWINHVNWIKLTHCKARWQNFGLECSCSSLSDRHILLDWPREH
jgi:hypothetical protein